MTPLPQIAAQDKIIFTNTFSTALLLDAKYDIPLEIPHMYVLIDRFTYNSK
jgi:hypothetical protein